MNSDGTQPSQQSMTIEAGGGLRVTIVDIGATIESVVVPLARGSINAVLSYDELRSYETDPYFLGSTVGPFANRIRNATFRLDDSEYRLDANEKDRGNCLHGGTDGLHRQRFSMSCDPVQRRIHCTASLADGIGGFPGNRRFDVNYELVDDWSLAIDFQVTTDKDTVVNLANHAYFNLGGSLDEHQVCLFSDSYTPVDESLIPTGELRDVDASEFDLRKMQPIGNRKFDHNFVLEGSGGKPRPAAQLQSPTTGLQLSVLTTQPALQVYTGDSLSDPFHARQGICLEAQGFPNAPNQPSFPSTRLKAGATYRQETIYRFAVTDDRS